MDAKQNKRRNDLIRCDVCGEEYSPIYKRCPFCEEELRSAGGGKRVRSRRGGGYTNGFTFFRILGIAVPIAVILIAVFVVFSIVSPMMKASSSVISSGDSASSSSVSTSSAQTASITLNSDVITLSAVGETYTLTATVSPADAQAVVWTSSNANVVIVDDAGIITAIGEGTATVTATSGTATAGCVVTCSLTGTAASSSTASTSSAASSSAASTTTSSGTISAGSKAVINTDKVNIRSGAGTGYAVQDTGYKGSEVTVMGVSDGWYQISYNSSTLGKTTGYIAVQYLSKS